MSISIGVAIIGGTGYGAGELLRIFTQHPHVEVVSVVSQSRAGTPIADAHPNLSGFYDGVFEASVDFEALSKYQFGAVFLGLPHGTSAARVQKILPALEAHNLHLFDMSGDFRLRNESIRSQFYPEASVPQELQERFVYGLAELNRESIRSARFLSIPGCLAATCELAALPLIDSEFSGSIVFDVKTGTSGAGRSPNSSFHHPSRFGNMNPYKVFSHRHEPEICQTLGDPKSERLTVSFVPHVIPISRGVYTSMYLTLPRAENSGISEET